MKFSYLIPISVLSIALFSCSGNTTDNTEKKQIEATTNSTESEDADYVLPQPISLANAFKEAGLTYITGKTNPTDKVDSYALKIDQLFNLGVYSTDLAYCAINGKAQEAREYLSVIQKLGTKVGLGSVFNDKELVAKFDKELSNPEELENLIYDIQDKTDVYMENNDLKYLGDVQFAGAWIEGMFLGVEQYTTKQDIGKTLVQQMSLLKNILKGLNSNPAKEDARLKEVISSFETILTTYEGLASVKSIGKNINVETPQLTGDEFKQLAEKVSAARTAIVNP
jgi:hypothetical protein